jgi:hypothetical protein
MDSDSEGRSKKGVVGMAAGMLLDVYDRRQRYHPCILLRQPNSCQVRLEFGKRVKESEASGSGRDNECIHFSLRLRVKETDRENGRIMLM